MIHDVKSFKQNLYLYENKILNSHAQKTINSKGRLLIEDADDDNDIRLAFQKDRDRIIHSKAFRRLKGKTQVFLFPIGDHYRTRLMHTLEVSQISRTIARALFFNEDLTEAIALGHDLGHTPFGHLGEKALAEIIGGDFSHYLQSKRIAEHLNLSIEVIDGIFKHSKGKGPILDDNIDRYSGTLEGQIVRVSDIIAYLNHDIDDAERAGLIKEADIPKNVSKVLGVGSKARYTSMVNDLIFRTAVVLDNNFNAKEKRLYMSEAVLNSMDELRDFLYKEVYENKIIIADYNKIKNIFSSLFDYYYNNPNIMFTNMEITIPYDTLESIVCDYISGMTDNFSLLTYKNLFLPKQW